MHRRQRVRQAAKALLVAALPGVEINTSPDWSLEAETTPAIDIYTPDERVEEVLSPDPCKQVYSIELLVSVADKTDQLGEDTASKVEAYCETVERALTGTLGNVVDNCRLTRSTVNPAMDDNNTSLWEALMSFTVKLTETTQPLMPTLPDLETLHSKFETSPKSDPPANDHPELTTTVVFD